MEFLFGAAIGTFIITKFFKFISGKISKITPDKKLVFSYILSAAFLSVVPPLGMANESDPPWHVGIGVYIPIMFLFLIYDMYKSGKLGILFNNNGRMSRVSYGFFRLYLIIFVPFFYWIHIDNYTRSNPSLNNAVHIYTICISVFLFGCAVKWVANGFSKENNSTF
jgi:hypothetical protein